VREREERKGVVKPFPNKNSGFGLAEG